MSKIHSDQSINYLLVEEKKQELKKSNNPKELTDYSQTIDDLSENLELLFNKEKQSVNKI